jgi:hypothetical protein
MPSTPRARQRFHQLLTDQSGRFAGNIRSLDSTLVPVADRHSILEAVGRHNILEAAGRLPSLGCRVAADIRIVLAVHTALLAHRNHRSVDTG